MEKYTEEQLASLAKERPKNESEKRFVISKEKFSTDRLDAVKQEVSEMQEKYPEVLSLCLFGSMVKGTAHEGSDIDGYLYIDSSLVAEKEGVPEDDVLEHHHVRDEVYLETEIAKSYMLEFRNGVKEKTGLLDKDVEHLRSRPISEKVINNRIEAVRNYYTLKDQYKKDSEQYYDKLFVWEKAKPKRGQAIELLIEHEKNKPVRATMPDFVSTGFGPMFHLDVGGGLRKYKKMFIDKLVQLGPEGEKIWEDTIKSTEMMENNLSTAPDKRYPRTLTEAIAVYGK